MKFYLASLLFSLLLIPFSSQSQIYVNGEDVNSLDIQYLAVGIGTFNPLNENKLVIATVDYGQATPMIGRRNMFVTEQKTKNERKYFNSRADALNWFYFEGWEVVSYMATGEENPAIFNFILQKRR